MDVKSLIGYWHLWRTICNTQTGKLSAMWGAGTFSSFKKGHLSYFEEVNHWTVAQTLHRATKKYGYRFTSQALEIYSKDETEGKFFLKMPLQKKNLEGTATCGSDCYQLHWRWQGNKTFWQRYCITGPRKNYVITSIFSR